MATMLSQVAMQGVQAGDMVLVGIAGAVLVGVGLLQKSIGNVADEESMLPPAASAKARRESQRSKRFLKRNKPKK